MRTAIFRRGRASRWNHRKMYEEQNNRRVYRYISSPGRLDQDSSQYVWQHDLSSSIEWTDPRDYMYSASTLSWPEEDLWDESSVALDRQTRQAMSLLLDQYQGRRRQDRATLHTCHRLMDQLTIKKDKGRPSQQWWTIRAHRAHAMLQYMELFFSFFSLSPASSSSSSPQPRQVMETPYPTSDTYYKVLNMLANAGDAATAKAVLERMQHHSIIMNNVASSSSTGSLLLFTLSPTTAHWNQVLSAYAVSSEPSKAQKAALVLDEMMSAGGVALDASSYSNVLRACIVQPRDRRTDQNETVEKEALLGSQIAIKVLQQFSDARRTSSSSESAAGVLYGNPHLYAFGLRALGQAGNASQQDDLVRRVMEMCCVEDGCCNNHVLQAFLAVASPTLQRQFLGPYIDDTLAKMLLLQNKATTTATTTTPIEKLIRNLLMRLPPEWSQHAQVRHRSGW